MTYFLVSFFFCSMLVDNVGCCGCSLTFASILMCQCAYIFRLFSLYFQLILHTYSKLKFPANLAGAESDTPIKNCTDVTCSRIMTACPSAAVISVHIHYIQQREVRAM